MTTPLETILNQPLGKQLSTDNWESYVYELGDDWVYKEIRTEHCFLPNVVEGTLTERITLQRFWCSDTHYKNALSDHKVIVDALSDWVPESHILQAPAKFSDNPRATITAQQKCVGTLLSNLPEYSSENLTKLRRAVNGLAINHFNAPLDFQPSNVMVNIEKDTVTFFDTGTPSDWKFFLDANQLQQAIAVSDEDAERFVAFMKPHHKKHWKKVTNE